MSSLQQGDDSQISFLFSYFNPFNHFCSLTMESSDSINEGKNDIRVLPQKQDSNVLTEALKDSLNKLDSALGNSVSKLSKSIDEKINKLNSAYTSGQPEDLNRERQETDTPYSDPNGKRRVGTLQSYHTIKTKRE